MNVGPGVRHMRFDAPTPRRMTQEEQERKVKEDYITYIRAGYTLEGAVAKCVADYRLWRKNDRTPFEQDLMCTYNKLFPRGSRHIYI